MPARLRIGLSLINRMRIDARRGNTGTNVLVQTPDVDRTLERELVRLLPQHPHAEAMIRFFVRNASAARSVGDVRLALKMSDGACVACVRELGFHRAEHLFTYLRAETWILLIKRGLDRRVVERFVGISDRSNFRRACRRARISTPWIDAPTLRQRGRSRTSLLAHRTGHRSGFFISPNSDLCNKTCGLGGSGGTLSGGTVYTGPPAVPGA